MAPPVTTTQTVAIEAMGLLYILLVDTEDGTTTVQMEANSKEEALVNPEPGEHKG